MQSLSLSEVMDRSFTAKDIRQAQQPELLFGILTRIPSYGFSTQLPQFRGEKKEKGNVGAETGRNCVLVVIHVNVELHGVVCYELETLNRQHLLFRPLFSLSPRLLWPLHDHAKTESKVNENSLSSTTLFGVVSAAADSSKFPVISLIFDPPFIPNPPMRMFHLANCGLFDDALDAKQGLGFRRKEIWEWVLEMGEIEKVALPLKKWVG
ncbi:hypothetical protein FF1_040040 [Malus domestica]